MDEHQKELLKHLPKIDEMILRIEKRESLAGFPREIVKEACRSVVEEIRGRILSDQGKGREAPAADDGTGGGPGRGDRRGLSFLPAPPRDQRDGGGPPHEPRPGAALQRGPGEGRSRSPAATPTWNTIWTRGSADSATITSGDFSAR